jgi:hypothetical protein
MEKGETPKGKYETNSVFSMHWKPRAGAHGGGCARQQEKACNNQTAAKNSECSCGKTSEHRCDEKRAQLHFNRATSAAIVHATTHQFRI